MAQIFPKSAVAVDGEGRTPLHLACVSGWSFDEEVANVLCQAGPSALGMECCDGEDADGADHYFWKSCEVGSVGFAAFQYWSVFEGGTKWSKLQYHKQA
eukprot:CAMPEP_0116049428 /NCGR_PEP_ID=MMETSP0321-20121206/30158_1 /TAXON_ID=163516 /ORGANISM="Leptocylindrus danicus var. danicus, Strain B650" /LENGTH=98 /DNA_ID=CAMNT_0003531851 /DNA_START=333 /DNA_END=628 /DNA_ORIENTATION=-